MSNTPNPTLARRLLDQLLSITQSRNNASTVQRFKQLLDLDRVDNTRDIDKPVSIPTTIYIQTGGMENPQVLNHTHEQTAASAVWLVVHSLQRYPNVTTVDPTGDEVCGAVSYLDMNTVQITFSVPMTGTAYCS